MIGQKIFPTIWMLKMDKEYNVIGRGNRRDFWFLGNNINYSHQSIEYRTHEAKLHFSSKITSSYNNVLTPHAHSMYVFEKILRVSEIKFPKKPQIPVNIKIIYLKKIKKSV